MFFKLSRLFSAVILCSAVFWFGDLCLAGAPKSLEDTQEHIISLIDAGYYAPANAAVVRMTADFAGDRNLPQKLWEVANRYDKVEAYGYSRRLCERIIAEHPADAYSTYAALQLAKLDVYQLIDAGQYEAAYSAAERMLADFAGHEQVCRRVWEAANRYEKVKAVEYSRRICERIVSAAGQDEYGRYAALQLAKLNALDLIGAGQYEAACSAAEQMLVDFAGHKQLCRRVWEVANRYEKVAAVEYSRRICERIVSAAGQDEYGRYAALQMAKLNVFDLIEAGDMEGAGSAVSRMMSDFAGHKQLSRRLYETAQMYAKTGAFSEARVLHSRVAAAYPQDGYGSRSAIMAAKLGICELIDAGEFAAAEAATAKMKSDFAGQEYLYEQLDSVAERYDRAGEDKTAKQIWHQIIEQRGPGSKAVIAAKARLAKHRIIEAMELGDSAAGDLVIEQLKSEFTDERQKRLAMSTLADDLYLESVRYPAEGKGGRAMDYLRLVIAIEQGEVVGKIGRGGTEPDACVVLAEAYERLGDYARSIEYCEKVLRDYPGSRHCWNAQFMIGQCYENMIATGQIERSQGESRIRGAYTNLLEKYPRCIAAAAARSWLDSQ